MTQRRPAKATLTRRERAELIDRMLDRYRRLGALIVGDNESLCRLLATLESDVDDGEIGDYLTSILTA